MDELDGASVAIIGLGASGLAAARLAQTRGGSVYASDLRTDAKATARADELREFGVAVELGQHDLARIASAEAVVVSPGIAPHAPVLRALRERGVRWVSEPEFAFRFFRSALIAVTGTNGKTTVAALTAHLLEKSGVDVGLGGNIGAGLGPAASELALREPAPDWLVVEVSSFQLADIETFRPDLGVLTNLAPDHLDRYPSADAYYADKARLFTNADEASRWVLPVDGEAARELPGEAPGRRYLFGQGPDSNAFVEDGAVTLRIDDDTERLVSVDELSLFGVHNVTNALAAALTARLASRAARSVDLTRALSSFPPPPHRLESLGERAGVLWINDSKATNVAATVSAIRSVARPLVLLLGGTDKGEDLAPLRAAVDERVRLAVVYGAAGERIGDALEGAVRLLRSSGTFEEAVGAGSQEARSGDALLLSPACSSFDMFESYEVRGECFRALARSAD